MKTASMATLWLASAVCVAQDPVKVAGNQYRLIAENENVRIVEANLAPGAKTVMHSHPALMSVVLVPGSAKWTKPDGKVDQSPANMARGSVISMGAESHVSENTGKTPLRVILVEFKKPAPPAGKAHKAPSLASCKQLADAPHATAQLCGGAAGSSVAKHTHASNAVYVALSDVQAEITDAGGKKRMLDMKKDTASIASRETHSVLNKGGAYELVVVDLK